MSLNLSLLLNQSLGDPGGENIANWREKGTLFQSILDWLSGFPPFSLPPPSPLPPPSVPGSPRMSQTGPDCQESEGWVFFFFLWSGGTWRIICSTQPLSEFARAITCENIRCLRLLFHPSPRGCDKSPQNLMLSHHREPKMKQLGNIATAPIPGWNASPSQGYPPPPPALLVPILHLGEERQCGVKFLV